MTDEEAREADLAIARSLEGKLCSDCPPEGYPNDKTRCADCPRQATHETIVQAIRDHFPTSIHISGGVERCYYNGWDVRELAEHIGADLARKALVYQP